MFGGFTHRPATTNEWRKSAMQYFYLHTPPFSIPAFAHSVMAMR